MFEVIINSVAYTLLILLSTYFVFRNIVLRRKVQDEITARLQASIEKNIVMSEYKEVLQALENKKLEESDDFVKFLSDTRNAAFDYIEDVQANIQEFDSILSDISKWNKTYGSVAGSTPHAEKIEQLSLAYDKLRNLLPENPTPNN